MCYPRGAARSPHVRGVERDTMECHDMPPCPQAPCMLRHKVLHLRGLISLDVRRISKPLARTHEPPKQMKLAWAINLSGDAWTFLLLLATAASTRDLGTSRHFPFTAVRGRGVTGSHVHAIRRPLLDSYWFVLGWSVALTLCLSKHCSWLWGFSRDMPISPQAQWRVLLTAG